MGLTILIVGLAVFFATHTFTTLRRPRAAVVANLGDVAYKGLYSFISLIGLVLIVYGFARYSAAGAIEVWSPPRWLRHVNNLLLWPAMVCLAAAYIPGDIKRVLKHPMLVGIMLWAFGHLLANGDLGSIILFGSFLAWAAYDRATFLWRYDTGAPEFGLGGRDCDTLAVIVGTLLYLALGFLFHPYVIGVPAFVR
ncbi:MAG: NnrU family protein [Hyphomicrobiales bacterium]|nr:NnrU family protein [Hyphomicrobiales bacterium]